MSWRSWQSSTTFTPGEPTARDEIIPYTAEEHQQHMSERKGLIDAARESAKSFDQAVLAFGSAIFGASIAFLKDVAPHPQTCTLKWLLAAWACFAFGLLSIMLSFLFSGKACMFEIDLSLKLLKRESTDGCINYWSNRTERCNYFAVALLFVGMISWALFAYENLDYGAANMKPNTPPNGQVERGYVPPPPPPKAPPPPPSAPPQKK